MAQERLSMRKIKEVLRLKFERGLSQRQVAKSVGVSRSTVAAYLMRAKAAGLKWPIEQGILDSDVELLLFPIQAPSSVSRASIDFAYIHQELSKKHTTLALLWEEYKSDHTDGYQYSQFCHHYGQWSKTLNVSMRQIHRAGEKGFVDYCDGLSIVDPKTGELISTQLFVMVLGASNYTFAEATLTQELSNWVGSHQRAFDYFEGVPEILVPDNLKSGVKKPCYYEPDINPTYHDLAVHYGSCVIPAHVRKPKHKAKAEGGVLLAQRWILAFLRNRIFYSLADLNKAIGVLLEKLNSKKMQKLKKSRCELFLEIEKPALKPLPQNPYVFAQWKKARVNIDYCIEIGEHYYSTPYQLIHQQVDVRMTATTVEAFFKGKRVASHRRSYRKYQFTILKEHMPKAHQKYLEWTPSRIIGWAKKLGPDIGLFVESLIKSKPHPEMGYRAGLGVIRLEKKYSKERLNAACKKASLIQAYSLKSIKAILKSGAENEPPSTPMFFKGFERHENIRGSKYYQ
jgi:transposase